MKKLYVQKKKWKHDKRNALCWSFYCVNDNKSMDVKCFELMRCNVYYANLILIINAKTQTRKCLILYNFTNEINALKNVYVDHDVIEKIFKEETNNLSKEPFDKNLQKNDFIYMELLFLNFLLPKIFIKK